MSTTLTLPAPSALSWRAALPELHARDVADELVSAVDSLELPARAAVLAKFDLALRSGVCDTATLAIIAEVVAASFTS